MRKWYIEENSNHLFLYANPRTAEAMRGLTLSEYDFEKLGVHLVYTEQLSEEIDNP